MGSWVLLGSWVLIGSWDLGPLRVLVPAFPVHPMKFGQSIECNMRNIFLEKTYTKWGGENSPRPFSEKLKLSISLTRWSKILYSLVLLYAKLRAIEIYWKWSEDHLLFPRYASSKNNRGLELVFLPHFLHNFWRKVFLLLY